MTVEIKPGAAKGSVRAPSSKSFVHRMLICAALSEGTSEIRNVSLCEDVIATIDCVRAIGAGVEAESIDEIGKESVRGYVNLIVKGTGGVIRDGAVLECRESGSTLRFMVPVALAIGSSAFFRGSERLLERGIGVYEEALGAVSGIRFVRDDEGISAFGTLKSGDYVIPGNVSSQYVTGLLTSLPLLSGDSTLTVISPVESRRYIDITVDVLRAFGIDITEDEPGHFIISGGQSYSPSVCEPEGDWSNAAFLLALDQINEGSSIEVTGLDSDSVQGDSIVTEHLFKLKNDDSPVIDISSCPDLGPILFAAAACTGGAKFTGTARLKIKESDRGNAMAEELSKFGVRVDVSENEVTVFGGDINAPEEVLYGHNDHRIVMSLAVLCTLTGGVIEGCEAVKKSWPGFFSALETLGAELIQR